MSALQITLSDLSKALSRIDLKPALEQAARTVVEDIDTRLLSAGVDAEFSIDPERGDETMISIEISSHNTNNVNSLDRRDLLGGVDQ